MVLGDPAALLSCLGLHIHATYDFQYFCALVSSLFACKVNYQRIGDSRVVNELIHLMPLQYLHVPLTPSDRLSRRSHGVE